VTPPTPPRHTRPIPVAKVAAVDNTPTAKVTAYTLAAAGVTVLVSIADHLDITVPADVAAALVTILGFVAGYWKRSRPGDFDL